MAIDSRRWWALLTVLMAGCASEEAQDATPADATDSGYTYVLGDTGPTGDATPDAAAPEVGEAPPDVGGPAIDTTQPADTVVVPDASDAGSTPPLGDDATVVTTDLPSTLPCGGTWPASITMKNTGTTTWTRDGGYKLGTVGDEDPFYGPEPRVWLPEEAAVAPGETWTFSFALTAPPSPGTHTTDWQMVHESVQWFGGVAAQQVQVQCEPTTAPTGPVGLLGGSLTDDGGPFHALGATLMWGAWGFRHDKARLEQNLAWLRDRGFDYIRVLGVVGDPNAEDYWDGREVDWHWPDYADVIAGLTDLAYQGYGLRVEWTLIGDGQLNIPNTEDRYALIDTFLAMSKGREQEVIHFEIANEAWQNGFSGDDGLAELRALTAYMASKTDILVAASAPDGHECTDAQAIYVDSGADLATVHFDRDTSKTEGPWRPVRQPWEHQFCEGLPVGSNNEPIGPGASVASEEDPERLLAAAITTYVAGLPLYVYHTKAGVRGDLNLWDMPEVNGFALLDALVPPDLSSWSQKNAHWADSPFKVYAGDADGALVPDSMWPDLPSPTSGAVRAYGAVKGKDFFVFPIGILGKVVVEPRQGMTFDVIAPMTGEVLSHHEAAAGEQITVKGAGALILRGAYW